MMNKIISRSAFLTASSVAALLIAPMSVHAAECFDKNTNDPKAGNATAVVGPAVDVRSESASDFSRPENGDDLFSGDHVRTGADSHLQLKLCDWSTYTFSPDSESTINEFYDGSGAGRRRAVNFLRGGFRFASGRDTEPGSTEVEIQDTGVTMGVRGTNVILVELDGAIYALLEGPVRDNSGLSPRGLVDFWTGDNQAAISASLKRPGFAVRIDENGVSAPFRADVELLRRIYQAFVPAVPEGDGFVTEYAGNPVDQSGQGAQEGEPTSNTSQDLANIEDDGTDQYPTETPGENEGPTDPPPVVIEVGEILPLDALEDFAAAQTSVDGHVFAIASAELFVDSGAGAVLEDEGVALIQLTIDWASRTIAPEAIASFIRLDFSVTDPNSLTRDDDTFVPQEIENAFLDAMLASGNVPFAIGENDVAVYPGQFFTFTIRQGANDTATVDVAIDGSATDQQSVVYNAVATIDDLEIMPGTGDLAYFDFPLSSVQTIAELDALGGQRGTPAILRGGVANLMSTVGMPTIVDGIMAGQIELDFGNRTVGGGASYIAMTTPGTSSGISTSYIALDQAVSYDTGLFNLAFFALGGFSSDASVLQGQVLLGESDGLVADLAAILSDGNGNHFYRELELYEDFGISGDNAVSTIAGLDSQSGPIETFFNVSPGSSFRYEASQFNSNAGSAFVTTVGGADYFGTVEASIDINFANRTIGGGVSYVYIDILDTFANYSLTIGEGVNTVSFDDAAGGVGVFGFDTDDFTGSDINSMLLLLHDGQSVGAGENADIYIDFSDGAGGGGEGAIENVPIQPGETPTG